MDETLNIAEVCPSSEALGPGKRFVLWVQGCPFSCKNCISPAWIPFERATTIAISILANVILEMNNISGITISGGEPFMQARALASLLQKVKTSRQELDVIIFSGFRLDQLTWSDAKNLLSKTDVLISGLYVEKKNDGIGLRGSNNQKVHFLTKKLLPYKEQLEFGRRQLEFHQLGEDILTIGIP